MNGRTNVVEPRPSDESHQSVVSSAVYGLKVVKVESLNDRTFYGLPRASSSSLNRASSSSLSHASSRSGTTGI